MPNNNAFIARAAAYASASPGTLPYSASRVASATIMRATFVTRIGEDEFRSVEAFDTVAPRLLGFDEPTRFRF